MADSLSSLTVADLLDRLASRAPTPGGGSASALAGATGAALLGMVLELTVARSDGTDGPALGAMAAAAGQLRAELTALVDRDAAAYEAVVAARRLPREAPDDAARRRERIAEASRVATAAPLRIVEAANDVLALAAEVAAVGIRSAISDVGVAGELAGAAVRGAALNVRINLPALADDDPMRADATDRLDALLPEADAALAAIRETVAGRMG